MNKKSLYPVLSSSKIRYAVLACTMFLFVTGLSVYIDAVDTSSQISVLSDDDNMPVVIDPTVSLFLNDNNVKQKATLLEIPFLQNVGQIENQIVQYYVDTFAGRVFVTNNDISYILHNNNNDDDDYQSYVIKEFVYSEEKNTIIQFPTITGIKNSTVNVSSFIGNDPDKWQSHIPTYDGISLGETWDGIDVSLHAYGSNVEKIFTVMPGHDPSDIKLSYDGISEIQIDDDGNIVLYSIMTDDNNNISSPVMSMSFPIAYQEIDGKKIPVDVKYNIINKTTYGFTVGTYDDKYPLVIDPIINATYLGGSQDDDFAYIAIDGNGNVFVTARTESNLDFPKTAGAIVDDVIFIEDIIVSKLNSDLTEIIQSTYIGSLGNADIVSSIAVNSTNHVFVFGRVNGDDLSGITPTSAQSSNLGQTDLFVTAFTNDLTSALFSTYLGTTSGEINTAMRIYNDKVYVVGKTSHATFPGIDGIDGTSFQSTNAGGESDIVISRLSSDLTSIEQSTFLGGIGHDFARGFGINSDGHLFIAGITDSKETDVPPFPGLSGGAQTVWAGGFLDGSVGLFPDGRDLFVAVMKNDLTTAMNLNSTYLGGSGNEDMKDGFTIVFDNLDNVYVGGNTSSNNTASIPFPGINGTGSISAQFDTDAGISNDDIFITKLDHDLTTFIRSTYLGGSGSDNEIGGIAISGTDLYVNFDTTSTDLLVNNTSIRGTHAIGESFDTYIAKLNNDLTSIEESTYLGGSGGDYAYDLLIDDSGNIYTVLDSNSKDFPGICNNGAQKSNGGNYDLIVVKLSSLLLDGQTTIDLFCIVESSGSGCSNCTPPTLGVDSRGSNMVTDGFTFNNKTTNVEYFYTPFELITINIGADNLAEFKIYDDGGPANIKHFEFAYGLDKGEYMQESKARIEYDIDNIGRLLTNGTWTGSIASSSSPLFMGNVTIFTGNVTLVGSNGISIGNGTLTPGSVTLTDNATILTGDITSMDSDGRTWTGNATLTGSVTPTSSGTWMGSGTWAGDITWAGDGKLTIVDPNNAIENNSTRIVTSTVQCTPTASYDCLLVQVHHVFRAPLAFDIVGTNVWDQYNNAVQNYYNHGIHISGESLNAPKEITVPLDTTQQHPARSSVDLLQIDITKDLWIDKWGYLWQGDSERMNLLSEIPVVVHYDTTDGYHGYSDRTHSEFSMAVKEQKIVANILTNEMYNLDTFSNSNYEEKDLTNSGLSFTDTLQMRQDLDKLKTEYRILSSQHDAQQLVKSLYPYVYSDLNNPLFANDTSIINDDYLQSLKEKINVMSMLINP